MKCPLKHTLVEATQEIRTWRDDDCLQKKCAWWDLDNGECIYQALNSNLLDLVSALKDIRDKMPHEGQFRR